MSRNRATVSSCSGRSVDLYRRRALLTVEIGTMQVHATTEAECVEVIMEELAAGRGGWLLTLNLDHLWTIARDSSFAARCRTATLTVADGAPLVWASHLQGTPLLERVTGSDLISSLTAAAAQQGRTVFFLGGAPDTAEQAARVLQQRHPELQVTGTSCPARGFENSPEELARIIAALHTTRPDIVYVALGKPKQEELIVRARTQHKRDNAFALRDGLPLRCRREL